MREVAHTDPDIVGGTPVFVGTRVPANLLFDYLDAGGTLDEFLRQFRFVRRDQAIAGIELARDTMLARASSTLLGEELPRDLVPGLAGHEVVTVQGLGWSGLTNGARPGRTAGHVDAFITMDSSFGFQPRLDGLAFGGGVIHARSNRMADLVPIIDSVLVARTRRSASENGRDAARHARPSPGGPLTSIVSDPKLPSGE